jgi:hypothetical protein
LRSLAAISVKALLRSTCSGKLAPSVAAVIPA